MTEAKVKKAKPKPLVVTGILAQDLVKDSVKRSKIKSKVISLPIQVAALINTKYIAKSLKSMNLEDVNTIIIPGMAFGDPRVITNATGLPAFKGPKYAADLPVILDNIDEMDLSTVVPACELMQEKLEKSILSELSIVERIEKEKIKKGVAVPVGKRSRRVWIGRGFKPCILAEIVDAPRLMDNKIRELARYYVDSGADIIDVGMLSEKSEPEEVKRVLRSVKKAVDNPISIDTSDVEEIKVAVKEGIDLVLSINEQNMEEVSKFMLDTPVVVTPVDMHGICPNTISKRINQLERNLHKALSLGFRKIIADPILNPPFTPSLMNSISGYIEFAKRDPSTPIFFGLGNITELLDCDSIGVNLLLTSMGLELDIGLILVTEASYKTHGCVKEVSTAIDMALLAKNRKSPPKDLGLNLLKLKEKRRIEEVYDDDIESKVEVIKPTKGSKRAYDRKGYFKIIIDRKRKNIVVIHFGLDHKPNTIFKGIDPQSIYESVLERDLISTMEHACYLGMELSRAKEALSIEKGYIQDHPLFNNSI